MASDVSLKLQSSFGMSRKYKFGPAEGLYFVSYAVVGWADLFVRESYRQIMAESLSYCIAQKGLILYAWCLMPSHVHLIFSTDGRNRPETILRDHKRHTSAQLHAAIRADPQESRREWLLVLFETTGQQNSNNDKWQLWRQDNHPIELYNAAITQQKLDYLHGNPVEAGFVDRDEDWRWSSARDYCGFPGLITGLTLLEPTWRQKPRTSTLRT
jgi:REP element-mobilizing transposase RayT